MNDDDLKKLREGRVNIGPTTINAIIDEALFRGAQVRACEDVGVQVILLPDGRASVNNYRALRVEAELAEARAALASRTESWEEATRTLAEEVNRREHAEQERDALKKGMEERARWAADNHCQPDNPCWEECSRGRVEHARIAANARAVAIAECAARVRTQPSFKLNDGTDLTGCTAQRIRDRLAREIESLSSSPPSGQWVAADVMEKVRNAIEQLAFGLDPEDFARPQDRYAAQLKISEDALKALFPDWNGPAMDEGRSMTRTGSELCAEIEALSSSLPSGHWVAADVMEKVKAALSEHSCDHCPGCEFPHGTSDEGDVAQLRAALSALESEASR